MDTLSELCRSCLSPNTEVSLFDNQEEIYQKFWDVTSVEVSPDDGLPQKLCGDCYAIMEAAYQFRTQCVKMDNELKLQIDAIIHEAEEIAQQAQQEESTNKDDEIANNPEKQLESIIKTEPGDSDDDCYYVLVIDDKDKDKEKHKEKKYEKVKINKDNVKNCRVQSSQNIELQNVQNIKEESQDHIEIPIVENNNQRTDISQNSYQDFMSNNYIVPETRVPPVVPATILENEEDSHDNEDFPMNIDDGNSQDSVSQNFRQNEDTQTSMINETEEGMTTDIENFTNFDKMMPTSKNSLLKILSSAGGDGTLVLKSEDKLTYLREMNTDGEISLEEESEVILCEGDDGNQYQIVSVDGSELVIEYADDSQIATVLQQEDGTFLCDCGVVCVDLTEYEKHQLTVHKASESYVCDLCGKSFESAEILQGHMLLHSVKGLAVVCPFCTELVKRNFLTQHIKFVHNNIKPICSICNKEFANQNNLKRHMMIHRGIKEFECDICLKRFAQKITMQTHRLTHINPYACRECDEAFDNRSSLDAHIENNQCTKSKVLRVKDEIIRNVKQEVTSLGKLLGYACSLCKKMFSNESALEQHIETAHIVDPSELLCSECGEVLPTKREMQTHILTHKNMKNKNIKRFECPTCGKSTASQAMLRMHERVHTNERPFECPLCSLRFKTKTHLRTHHLTHTREKKFGCSICLKFFALKGNLVVHLRTHTGERPYVCSLCHEAFIDSKYLKKHKLKKHSINIDVPWNEY